MPKVPLIDKLEALTRNEAFQQDWKWYKEKIRDPLFWFRSPLNSDRRWQDEDRIARLKSVLGDLLPDPWVRLKKLKKLKTPPKSSANLVEAVRVSFWDDGRVKVLKNGRLIGLEIDLKASTRTEILEEVGKAIDAYRKIIRFRDRADTEKWSKKTKQGLPSKWEVFDKAKREGNLLKAVKTLTGTVTGVDSDLIMNDKLKSRYNHAQFQIKQAKRLIKSSYPSRSPRS